MKDLSDKQFFIVGGTLLGGLILLTWAGKKAVDAAVDTGKGIATGNNALTKGTSYEGAGIVGTLGAAANEASGGFLEKLGSSIGGTLYDWIHPDESNINEQMSKSIGGDL